MTEPTPRHPNRDRADIDMEDRKPDAEATLGMRCDGVTPEAYAIDRRDTTQDETGRRTWSMIRWDPHTKRWRNTTV